MEMSLPLAFDTHGMFGLSSDLIRLRFGGASVKVNTAMMHIVSMDTPVWYRKNEAGVSST